MQVVRTLVFCAKMLYMPPRKGSSRIVSAAAQRLGVDPMTVYRYVSGDRYPSLPVVRRIEETFGWSITEQVRLMPDEGKNPGYGIVLAEVLKEHFPDFEGEPANEAPVLRRNRDSTTWSVLQVADDCGSRHENIDRWLKGQRYPSLKTMQRFQQLWGWPVAEQVVLIPMEGYNQDYGNAFAKVLDAAYGSVTKIT